ncbi:MAG: histidine kinase, partial [Propionicimonas sp.]
RDLHDGAQQHLVVSTMHLGEAVYWLDHQQPASARDAVLAAQDAVETALAALRDTIRGIHPQVLTDRGLVAAVHELAARQPVPVTVRVSGAPLALPASVENAAYYVTSEALTNVVKHAAAAEATVRLDYSGRLLLQVADNGRGGAHQLPGHGVSGLAERVRTAGGTFELTSPPGGPTLLSATFPYAGRP